MDAHTFILTYSFIAVFFLLFVNGAINFPSSQIIYIICGVFIARGSITFLPVFFAGALGNTLGNMLAYILIYIYGETVVKKLLLVDHMRLVKFQKKVQVGGFWILAFAKLIPSLKILVPAVAGLVRLLPLIAFTLFLVTSFIWAAMFIGIGYFFGEYITGVSYSVTMGLIALAVAYLFYSLYIKEEEIKTKQLPK